jgi:hypothetical protein
VMSDPSIPPFLVEVKAGMVVVRGLLAKPSPRGAVTLMEALLRDAALRDIATV